MRSRLLLSLLLPAFSRTFCDAQCSREPISNNGCIKHGKLHQVHTVWRTNDCERCECKPQEMVCCIRVVAPASYDREKCIPLFHKPTCSIRVVKKNNPLAFCKVWGWVAPCCGFQRLGGARRLSPEGNSHSAFLAESRAD